jgi:hypothetical protein
MDGRVAARIEKIVDASASLLLAAAVAYALHALLAASVGAAAGGTFAFALCFAGLRKVAPEPRQFELSGVEASTPLDELLAGADRIIAREQPTDELILDDVLAEVVPGSQVVRLFDRDSMPTPGEIKARIDRHIAGEASPDASQALFDALAELRRSLR